ncbi:MAG: hypothetical protein HY565_04595 [Candidatus Kerfeldbacteria bacterium]|nr:hypothetical protein [Candidatus Kerfeldbacteria bacterium]
MLQESGHPHRMIEPTDREEHPGQVLKGLLDEIGSRLAELGVTDEADVRLHTLQDLRNRAHTLPPDDRFGLERLRAEADTLAQQIRSPHVAIPHEQR